MTSISLIPFEKAGSTLRCSQAVPHPSTNRALCRFTSEVRRDPVHLTRYGRQQKSACRFSLNSKLKLTAKGELREMKCLHPPPDTAQNNISLGFGTFRLGKTHVPKKGNLAQPRFDEAYFLKNENYIFRRGQTVFLTHTCKNEHFASTRCVFWLNTTQCLTRFLLFRVYGFRLAETQVPAGTSQEHQPAGTCL